MAVLFEPPPQHFFFAAATAPRAWWSTSLQVTITHGPFPILILLFAESSIIFQTAAKLLILEGCPDTWSPCTTIASPGILDQCMCLQL